MLWTNPGHQLDNLGEKLLRVKKLYIYGNDEIASKAYDFLKWLNVSDEFEIFFVIDDSIYAQDSSSFCGKPVLAFQKDVCEQLRYAPETGAVILPFISKTNERTILENLGVTNIFYLIASHNRRDNFIQNFLCTWLMYRHGKLCSHSTNYLVTARCNLNCKHCLNFNHALINPKDILFEDFKQHIDTFFSKFDYVYSFHFTGGEPLLSNELLHIISYINTNYKEKIFEFFVITNGTILPSEELILEMQKINGSFLIDDYSDTCPQTKLEKIGERLSSHGIPYTLNKADAWVCLEAETANEDIHSESELEYYKDNCNSYLHECAEGKLYACCYQKYAERAGLDKSSSDEYIDISSSSKMEILEFRQGYTVKGYVDYCKRCRGLGANSKNVMPAVQLPRRSSLGRKLTDFSAVVNGLVSIGVPIYNTSPYLRRCIDSLLAQTYSALELILVDDGSDDGSETICDTYAAIDDRIHVIHKINGGEASARNSALRAAKGQYIMFIDSDDEYLPHAVQRMVDAIQKESADLAIGGYLERRGDKEFFACCHRRWYSAPDLAHDYLTTKCSYDVQYLATSVNAKLFSRELIIENNIFFDEHYVIGNDSIFMCEYFANIKTICAVFEPIYIYYKYHVKERIQGMAWHYPDSFFLFVYISDKMMKIANLGIEEHHKINALQYKNFIYGFINSFSTMEFFEKKLEYRLEYFCSKIDLIYQAAQYTITEKLPDCIDVPLRLISFLIKNKDYSILCNVFKLVAKIRYIAPSTNTNIRMMIMIDREQTCTASLPISSPNLHLDISTEEAYQAFKQLESLYEDIIIEKEASGDNATSKLLREELLLLQECKYHPTIVKVLCDGREPRHPECIKIHTECIKIHTDAQRILSHPIIRVQRKFFHILKKLKFWK